jgi:hypothetical protein
MEQGIFLRNKSKLLATHARVVEKQETKVKKLKEKIDELVDKIV